MNSTVEQNSMYDKSMISLEYLITFLGVAFTVGIIIGVSVTVRIIRKCARNNKLSVIRSSRGSYRVSTLRDVESNIFDNRIYGTASTYLTEDERCRLGMGKVMNQAATQTDITEINKSSKRLDYLDDSDYAKTYVLYQNIFQHLVRSCNNKTCDRNSRSSPVYDLPEVVYVPYKEDSVDGEHEGNDSDGYVDPALIHPKRTKSTKSTKVRHDSEDGSSDSDSEKEMVDYEMKEFALKMKLKSSKRQQSVTKTGNSSKRSHQRRQNSDMKSGYMVMELTPEVLDMLQNHAKSAKQKHELEGGSLYVRMKNNSADDNDTDSYMEFTG